MERKERKKRTTGTNLHVQHAGNSELAVGLHARSCGVRLTVLNTQPSQKPNAKWLMWTYHVQNDLLVLEGLLAHGLVDLRLDERPSITAGCGLG